MIEIAGGILLAVLALALLPWIIVGLSWTFGAGLMLAITGAAAWIIWTGAQSTSGLVALFVVGGVFLVWLAYEAKARREMKVEQANSDNGSS
jgi:riboflavin transporter FmnP